LINKREGILKMTIDTILNNLSEKKIDTKSAKELLEIFNNIVNGLENFLNRDTEPTNELSNDMGFTIYTGRVISLAYAKCVGRITISLPYSEMMKNRTLAKIISNNIYAKKDIIDIIEKLTVFADTDK
jgi:hypothetical protein